MALPKVAEIKNLSPEDQGTLGASMLEAIQANIRRYGWQALSVRLTAVILASLFMMFGYASRLAYPASFRFWPAVVLFLLWMLDGHYKMMHDKYVDLYHDTLAGASTDLSVKVDDRYNVSSLWTHMIMVPYVAMIALIALANLGF